MMTHRELFFAVAHGNRPRIIPFVPDITDWYGGQHRIPGAPLKYGPGVFVPGDDPIKFERGIGIPEQYLGLSLMDIHTKYDWGIHVHTRDWYEERYDESIRYSETVEGNVKTVVYHTPSGTLDRVFKLAADGSWGPVDHLMDDAGEMDILLEIIRGTHFRLLDENIRRDLAAIGERGQSDIVVNRSPFGKLLHEYLGFENTAFLLYDDPQAYRVFEEVQTAKDLELIDLACRSSCSLVLVCDHADATLFSPQWYETYCMPFYRQAGDRLRAAGKLISTHVDGNLKSLLPLMRHTGFDLLDGCTPAPMFDYTPEDLAAALGDGMSAFVGVPSSLFCDGTPLSTILAYTDRLAQLSEGRLILNVGDILPVNGNIDHVIAMGRHIQALNERLQR